jgi:hypothetical protein
MVDAPKIVTDERERSQHLKGVRKERKTLTVREITICLAKNPHGTGKACLAGNIQF